MINYFDKRQTQSVVVSLAGIIAFSGVFLFFALGIVRGWPDWTALIFIAVFVIGIIMALRFPLVLLKRRRSIKGMLKAGLTREDIGQFNREFRESKTVYPPRQVTYVIPAIVTEHWVCEQYGNLALLFPISGIVHMRKELVHRSINGTPVAIDVYLKMHFKDNRSARICVKVLKVKDAISMADKEFAEALEYLAARSPQAEIHLEKDGALSGDSELSLRPPEKPSV
jgi:hypothetical protein